MKIKEITIASLFGNNTHYSFDDDFNIIHSEKNARGKTTLIRLILYAMGFPAPATEGIKSFDGLQVSIAITNNGNEFMISRHGGTVIVDDGKEEIQMIMPYQQYQLHETLFGIKDTLILENLLGLFYIDQEKGWTMFNRGKVIGNIQFNIENFIAGISDIQLFECKAKKDTIDKRIKKYENLLTISDFQNEVITADALSSRPFYNNNIVAEINKLKFLIGEDNKKITTLKEIIHNNEFLIAYIEKIGLNVIDSGKKIPVTRKNIENFNDNMTLLETQLRQQKAELNSHKKKLLSLEDEIASQNRALGTETVLEKIEQEIKKIRIDRHTVERALQSLREQKRMVAKEYKNLLEKNNAYIDQIYQILYGYAHELGVSRYLPKEKSDFIWTTKLKGFSGKTLAQLAFCFRLTYLQIFSEKYKIKLPIIIDSPRSSEMSAESAGAMIKILERDFKDHQIIIASNYDDFLPQTANRIELENGALGTLNP